MENQVKMTATDWVKRETKIGGDSLVFLKKMLEWHKFMAKVDKAPVRAEMVQVYKKMIAEKEAK